MEHDFEIAGDPKGPRGESSLFSGFEGPKNRRWRIRLENTNMHFHKKFHPDWSKMAESWPKTYALNMEYNNYFKNFLALNSVNYQYFLMRPTKFIRLSKKHILCLIQLNISLNVIGRGTPLTWVDAEKAKMGFNWGGG